MSDCSSLEAEINSFTDTIPKTIKDRTDSVKISTEKKAEDIAKENPTDTGVFFKIEVTWTEKPISFDLPSVTIKDTPISFDLPTMEMRNKDIIFHVPECKMEDRVVGRYPEFHGLGHIVWKDIITTVPVCENKEQKIIIGVPEVKMKRQEFIMGLPVFSMVKTEIKLKYPEFKFVNVTVEMKKKGEDLETETQVELKSTLSQAQSQLTNQFREKHTKLFDCLRTTLLDESKNALLGIDATIIGHKASITEMKSKNVPADNEMLVNTETHLKDMVLQRTKVEEQFKPALDKLNEAQKKSFEDFASKFKLDISEPVPV